MGRDDVKRALMAMDDDEVRRRLSVGDFDALANVDLSEEEQTLVRDAASDYPEVAGFSFEDITINCGSGMSKGFYEWVRSAAADNTQFLSATKYAQGR